jgi:phosphoglucosamine mutase
MGKYFGTDGFRGDAGTVLTADHAYRIGRILGIIFKGNLGRARAVIGKDTRLSSYMLEYAIAAGLAASGADAYMLHVTTTPCVSYATATGGFDIGIMISASHNVFSDNGIKVIGRGGEKIGDEEIAKIEALMDSQEELPFATGEDVGRIVDYYEGRNRYIGYLISLSKNSFKKLKIGLDCSNGGSWMIAKAVFEALGANVRAIGTEPDGTNINRGCGSTHIENLSKLVKEERLDMGFAFDGDADRCIAVDSEGCEVNGDHILYVLGTGMKRRGELFDNKIVTTVMSNLGLYRALDKIGVEYEQTAVGDRFVYECMQKEGYQLGGEQSGHVIMSKYATTGDGILTAIKLTEEVIESKKTLRELASEVTMLPQLTVNIRVKSKSAVTSSEKVIAATEQVKTELGKNGRILLRQSGTEPVIRIMVEAESVELCRALTERVANVIRAEGLAEV